MAAQPNQGQPPSTINPLRDVVIVGGSISATSAATATAVAPTYAEGSVQPLSQDLSGQLRISGTINASSAAQATTADPSYTNNTSNPFSQTLAGYLRVSAKQSGSWSVGIDQTTPGVTNLVNVSNLPNVVDTNAGAASASTLRFVLASGGASQAVTGTFFQATQPVSATSLPLPTGAATAAGLTTINTTLGSPFQAGASIGNTTFASTQSGTWNIGTVTTITGVTTAFGALASAVPANAVANGMRGTTANPTAVTDGQLVGAQADKVGRTVVVHHAARDLVGSQKTTISASTAETTIVTAAASIFNDLLSITLVNSGATATKVDIRDATAGTIQWTGYVPATDMRGITFPVILKQTTINNNWTAQCSASTTALEVTVQFVKNI